MSEGTSHIQFRAGELAGAIAARQEGGASAGETARRDLARYYAALAAALRHVDLSEAEAMLIVDSLNGTVHEPPEIVATMLWAGVADDIADGGLDVAWGVDGAALIAKLRALPLAGALAIVDAVERWWALADAAEGEPVPDEDAQRLRAVGLLR